ncbi:hypothetical protein [Clostridium sp. KNHs216]|uniref:hypothetical protein n=1 Tax=Clostridium sp. KNHs216 TaxID=1550235 RepID=UPI00114F82C6|nr:hypothetical protein [Clostridium sp. KNHs216]TQI66210.1 hypothetical protein LY85_0869 [Clostridium sp. KNHs216]
MKDRMVKRVEAVLLAAVCTVGLAACSSQTTTASATAAQSASQQGADNQTTVYGKVTAVDGSKITLALGTLNRGEGGGRQESGKGQGGASGSEQKGNPPSKDNTASGGDSSEGKNQRQQGSGGEGGFEMLTLTGETKTITISDESILTRQSMRGNRQTPDGKTEQGTGSTASSAGDTSDTYSTKGVKNTNGNESGESASLSDITVGSVLKVTSETGTDQLVSVQILGGGTREKPEESSSSSQS